MNHPLLLSINIGLLVSYAFKYDCHSKIHEYQKDLTGDLLARYEKIRTERFQHFVIGAIIAVVVSLIYYNTAPTPILEKLNVVLLFLLLLPVIVYTVLPKSDYMLKHSQTEQDFKDWFNIYLCMRSTSVQGFLTGFALSMIIFKFIA
jgi:hypothetical protein